MGNIKAKWLWALCGVLVLLNVYSLFERNKVQQVKEKLNIEHQNLAGSFEIFQNNIQERTLLELQTEQQVLDITLPISNPSLEERIPLEEVLNEKKLVFKYSEVTCQVCVDQVFAKIDTLINAVDQDRLLLMANYENPRDLYTFKRVNNIDQIIFNLGEEKLGLAAEQSSGPLFFVAYPNGKISHLFLPDKSMPRLTDEYIKFMRTNFSQF